MMEKVEKPGIKDLVYMCFCVCLEQIIFRGGKGTDGADERSLLSLLQIWADLHKFSSSVSEWFRMQVLVVWSL